MRLSQLQHDIIIQETKKMFGISVTIRLFGSRVNDKLKGGDIDLFLEFPNKNPDLWKKILHLNTALQKRLGEQKIDIIAHQRGEHLSDIHKEALKNGIIL